MKIAVAPDMNFPIKSHKLQCKFSPNLTQQMNWLNVHLYTP